ncbi:MAG: hypothetical protein WCV85_04595 [Patescibacteria group bacterium]
MHYHDPLFGPRVFPDFIGELAETPLMQRTLDISQDVLPASVRPVKTPSRYVHGFGVCGNMLETVRVNPELLRFVRLLLVGGLLHDTGNAALSHLTEPFLQQLFGKNGETFLEDMLARFKTGPLLQKIGVVPSELVRLVSGQLTPLSTILHGSMDVDNLDNVYRFWLAYNPGSIPYDPHLIARAFRFTNHSWYLQASAEAECRRWQDTREKVYGIVYGEPNLNVSLMVYRAVYLAFQKNELTKDFFFCTDAEALAYLLQCNAGSACLVQSVLDGHVYSTVYQHQTTTPSQAFQDRCKEWDFRSTAANYLQSQLKIPAWAVTVYAGAGRDRRQIKLPFRQPDGTETCDENHAQLIYRLKVFLAPGYETRDNEVRILAQNLLH